MKEEANGPSMMTDELRKGTSLTNMAMSDKIPYNGLNFVIMHCPQDIHANMTISKLQEHSIHHVFRICEKTYDSTPYEQNGIQIHDDIKFVDGGVPSKEQVQQWLAYVEQYKNECIAVHCVSGIGRAPVLVALAFINRGLEPLECIEFVRKYRRRAFNNVQINFLSEYLDKKSCCTIL